MRSANLGELKALEPWTLLPAIGRANLKLFAMIDDAHARIVDAYGGDVVSQAMGEQRMVIALVSTPRARGRVALRSKQTSGLADDIGRGLKLLDGLVVSVAAAKSIGDRFLETHFDVSTPSVQEGNAVLPVALRQLLVNGGFRGVLELRPGVLAVVTTA